MSTGAKIALAAGGLVVVWVAWRSFGGNASRTCFTIKNPYAGEQCGQAQPPVQPNKLTATLFKAGAGLFGAIDELTGRKITGTESGKKVDSAISRFVDEFRS